jgi:hypothetical protein
MTQDHEGVTFPLVDGARSTTAVGKRVFADAARVVDPGLAAAIEAERDWRGGYLTYARRLLEASLSTAHEATAIPRAGLDSLHRCMVFQRDGEDVALDQALRTFTDPALHSITIKGEGASTANEPLGVPYRRQRLRGDALHRQLDRWIDAGVVEPSFAEAVRAVMANPDWLDLSDVTVAVLGAGAEMGPLHSLCRWNATVLPVDLDSPAIWGRILRTVREGSGKAHIPVREAVPIAGDDDAIAAVAGANVITHAPEIATWLSTFEGPLTIGNYVYADGATHVRVSMAVDAITARLATQRDDLSLAVLATPTDVFAVPADVVEASRRRLAEGRMPTVLRNVTRTLSRNRLYAPNYERLVTTPTGRRLGIADSLVAQQGPNYALAKRLQRWRASVARADGMVTSINVAPPTRTRSVLRNRVLAAAYAGAGAFDIEVFDPSTSNTLMAALLVHDLRNPAAVAQPSTTLDHPLQLFWQGANHGGLWRNPYAARSVLGLAVVLGMVQRGA